MGTATMEPNLVQELASVYNDPIFLVLLEPWKDYDNLDCGCILQTSEGYGAGTKIRGIMEELWSHKEVITQQNVYHGPQFSANRGST